MRRHLFFAIVCVFLSAACVQDASAVAHERSLPDTTLGTLNVQLEEVRVLGNDPNAAPQYLFGLPQYVATDEQGRIYVADAISMNVRIYSSEGRHLQTVGTRGEERGGMRSIKELSVEDGQVLVYDRENARITRFAADGRVLATHSVSIPSSTQMRALRGQDGHAVLYSASNAGIASGIRLFHLYGSTFQETRAQFGRLSEVADQDEPVVQIHYSHFPGRFTITDAGHVVYAPALYDGELYQYEQQNGSWALASVFEGYTEKPPYASVTSGPMDTDHADMVTSIAGRADPIAALLHNRTRGLFQLQDGRLVHFTFSEFGSKRVFGVEVFDQEGNFVGYGPIQSVDLGKNGIANLRWDVACKDDEDRFYIIDREGENAVVRIVKLKVQPRS